MDDVEIPEIMKLNTKERLLVLVVATVAGFAAENLTNKGLTKVLLNRKS